MGRLWNDSAKIVSLGFCCKKIKDTTT